MSGREQVKRSAKAVFLWLAALAAAFAVVLGLAYVLGTAFGIDRAPLYAGVIATFTGVAGGIPVGLLAGRLADAEARQRATKERAARRTKLLVATQRDLTEIMDELVGRDRTQATIPYLRTDVWRALSVSGELGLLDDPELLNVLARAYHRVGTTADLERQIWEAFHDPNQWTHRISRPAGEDVSATFRQSLEQAVRDQDPHTKAAIDVALTRLAAELGERPPPNRPLRS